MGTHPLPQTLADTGLSKAGRRLFHLCLRPSFPSAFRPISPSLAQVCFIDILSTHSPALDSPLPTSRAFTSHLETPPLFAPSRLLPTVSNLNYPGFSCNRRPLRLLPSAPPPRIDKRPPPQQPQELPSPSQENGEALVGWMISDGRTCALRDPRPLTGSPEPRAPSRAAPTSCPRSAASPPRAAGAALREGRRPAAPSRGVAAGDRARQSRTCSSLWALCGWVCPAQTTSPRRHCSELSSSPPCPCLRSGRLALKGTQPE